MLRTYSYDVTRHELAAYIQPEAYLPREQWQRIQSALRTEPLRYRWTGARFELID
jgi:hypothetical protein